MRLRQIGRGPPQNLVLLLQQLDPPTRFPKLGALLAGRSGLGPVVNVRATHPLPQRHRMDSEVGGHLLDRHTRPAVPGDPHDVLAELFRIRLGHSDILPTRPTGQASSDVTRSCGRPLCGALVMSPFTAELLQKDGFCYDHWLSFPWPRRRARYQRRPVAKGRRVVRTAAIWVARWS